MNPGDPGHGPAAWLRAVTTVAVAVTVWTGSAAAEPAPVAADLVFDTTLVDLFPEPGMATAVASFPCRNTGNGTQRVVKVDYGCACTGWSVQVDGRPVEAIPPHAKGMFQLAVSVVGGSQGRQWKSATFRCLGDDGEVELHTLRFSYDTGSAIQLTSKCLYWDIGEAAAPKTTTFAVRGDADPIHLVRVIPRTPGFTVETRTIEPGRRYQIIAAPQDGTAAPLIGSALVETDSPFDAWRSFTVFLLVTRVQH